MRRSSRILKPLFEQLDAARSKGELEGTATRGSRSTRGGGITEAFIKVSDDFRDMRYVGGGWTLHVAAEVCVSSYRANG